MSIPDPIPARKPFRSWFRVLRPLIWWLILVLVLYSIRLHERWIAQTRISFKVDLGGRLVDYEASVALDGQRIMSGQRVALGRHHLAVTHPKAESFSTNFFVWYGEHDLGKIGLNRTHGHLAVEIKPPAANVLIRGPEFSVTLTNSTGLTSSVPTDVYAIESRWANYQEATRATVSKEKEVLLSIAPPLGVLIFESDPSGATVVGEAGNALGNTPLVLLEMRSGVWKGELRLAGHIPVPLTLAIIANQTNSFRTNLVNRQYSQAMTSARQFIEVRDFDRALEALASALQSKPADPDATALQREAEVGNHVQQAKALLNRKSLKGARLEIEATLKLVPNNEEAQALLVQVDKREQENRQREAQEADARQQARLSRGQEAFKAALASYEESDLFDSHELKTTKPVKEVETAILETLGTKPFYLITKKDSLLPGTFVIEARQEFTTLLATSAGRRQCVIVGAQTKDDETQVLFKVLEFKAEAVNKFSFGALINAPSEVKYAPIHPSRTGPLTEKLKTRLDEGVVDVTTRIQRALGNLGQ